MCYLQASEAVRDQHDRARRRGPDGLVQGADPLGAIGVIPVAFLNAAGVRKAQLPARLPVSRPGTIHPGQDQDLGVHASLQSFDYSRGGDAGLKFRGWPPMPGFAP